MKKQRNFKATKVPVKIEAAELTKVQARKA